MWAMRRCSVKGDVGVIRCCFTKGRCWQCPNPARPNRAYCRLHRTSDNDFKIKDFLSSSSPSDPANSNRESSSDPKDSSSNDNSKKRKRESKKKKEGEEEGENDARQQQVAEAKSEAKAEAEVIRKVLPNGVITISSPLPKPTTVSPYLTKTTKDGKEVRVVIGDQRKFRCKNANVSGLSSEQLDIRDEISLHQVKRSNPITETRKSSSQHLVLLDDCYSEATTVDEMSCETGEHTEAVATGSEVNGADETNGHDNSDETGEHTEAVATGSEVNGADETNGHDNSDETGEHTEAVATVSEVNGAVDETNGHDNSPEVENSYHHLYQLFPPLKHLNLDQIFELEIDANFQGNLIAGVHLPVVKCTDDVVFNCNHCQIRIENLHRSCMKCNFKLCVECCQTFRLQSSTGGDTTVNSRNLEMQKAIEIHDKKITCPVTLGGCAEDYLKIRCLVPVGWKHICAEKQDCPVR